MKNHKTYYSVLIPMAVTMFGVASLYQARASSHKNIASLKSYTVRQRDKAVKEIKAALENLDKRIENLENHLDKNWDEMDKAARQEARAGLKQLHQQRNGVAEWYGSIKNGSTETWDNIKEGFSDAYQELYDTWKETEEQLHSNH